MRVIGMKSKRLLTLFLPFISLPLFGALEMHPVEFFQDENGFRMFRSITLR
jgi:hypothetical protein